MDDICKLLYLREVLTKVTKKKRDLFGYLLCGYTAKEIAKYRRIKEEEVRFDILMLQLELKNDWDLDITELICEE